MSDAGPNQRVWHGTQTEVLELMQCLTRNCTCECDPITQARTRTCEPHRMLQSDQRALDGLLFARRIAACLKREEFSR